MRDREFSPFAFTINRDSVPELADTFTSLSRDRDKPPSEYDLQLHMDMLKEIFPVNDNCSARTFHDLIREQLARKGVKIGSNRCREFLEYYQQQKILVNRGDNKMYKLVCG